MRSRELAQPHSECRPAEAAGSSKEVPKPQGVTQDASEAGHQGCACSAEGQLNSHEAASSSPVPEEPSVLEDSDGFVDDVNGGILPMEAVKKASGLEMDYLYKQGVYRVVKWSEITAQGIKPIEVRWIDTKKGDPRSIRTSDPEHPNYRGRFVVREIKAQKSPEEQLPANLLFGSTPPLEAMRLLAVCDQTNRFATHGKRYKLYGTSLEHSSMERRSGRLRWSFRQKIQVGVKIESMKAFERSPKVLAISVHVWDRRCAKHLARALHWSDLKRQCSTILLGM